jgi:hypothetical protein
MKHLLLLILSIAYLTFESQAAINTFSNNGIFPNGIHPNGVQPNGLTHNGFTHNGFTHNGLMNGIINGITLNGLINGVFPNGVQPNGWTHNGAAPNGFNNGLPNGVPNGIPNGVPNGVPNGSPNGSPNGLPNGSTNGWTLSDLTRLDTNGTLDEVLPYLIHCALPPWKTWVGTLGGEEKSISGIMGLAADLMDFPMLPEQQLLVSGCLLASINFYGKHIEISTRISPIVATIRSEIRDWGVYEGAFFGNIFTSKPKLFACKGTSTSEALEDSKDREWRRCTDNGYDCGVDVIGDCEEYCDLLSEDYGYAICTGSDGITYPAINVYLQSNDST